MTVEYGCFRYGCYLFYAEIVNGQQVVDELKSDDIFQKFKNSTQEENTVSYKVKKRCTSHNFKTVQRFYTPTTK